MAGLYQVVFIDKNTGDVLDTIDALRWHDLSYERKLNDYGMFSLTLDRSDTAAQFAGQKDMLIDVLRKNPGDLHWTVEETFFQRLDDNFSDENDHEIVVIGGVGLVHLLKRPIIRPEDDPTNVPTNTGYSTKYDVADVVMRELVYEQCVAPATNAYRIRPGLSVAPVGGTGIEVYIRESKSNLLEILKDIAVRGMMDFEILRGAGATFTFYARMVGYDKRLTTASELNGSFLLFDQERLNIRNVKLTRDSRDEINYVYVQGQGPEEDREELPRWVDTINDSPWNLIEGTVDAGNTEAGYIDGLITAGDGYLRENQATEEFTFEPLIDATEAHYREDFDLGDYCTARHGDYQQDLRITTIAVTVNASGEMIVPTLEELKRGEH